MSLNKKDLENTIQKIFDDSKKRNFDESVELIFTFNNLNIKNKDHRFDYFVNIPHPFISKIKSVAFVKDKHFADGIKGVVNKIIFDDEISKIKKKDAKKIANEYDLMLAEGPVMLTVGKYLGQILSPRGKMPQVAPPNPDAIKSIIKSNLGRVKISNKKNKSSVAIQTRIGKRSQSVEDIASNALVAYNSLIEKLPAGKHNIKDMLFKTTMGMPLKVGGEKK